MAYPKRLNAANITNQEKAIEAHSGFVNYVIGKVKRIGVEKVLKQYKTAFKVSKYFWLKEAYEKVLNFAQDVQIKRIAPKPPDPDDDIPMKLPIVRLYATQTQEMN